MDATGSMLRALNRTRTMLNELEDAAHDRDVDFIIVGEDAVRARGPWLDVHFATVRASQHLSVPLYMSEETEPGSDTYVISSDPRRAK